MTKSLKVVTITLTILVVLCGLALLGVQLFTCIIYSQRTCEWLNIDNIELHAGVDIPKIRTCDCEYDKDQNIKTARFELDKSNVDMDWYIKTNRFKKLDSTTDISFDAILRKDMDVDQLMSFSGLYYTLGTYQGETWQTLLDSSSGQLWVTINYKD